MKLLPLLQTVPCRLQSFSVAQRSSIFTNRQKIWKLSRSPCLTPSKRSRLEYIVHSADSREVKTVCRDIWSNGWFGNC